MERTPLSSEHINAVNRRRRLINHYDAALYRYGTAPLEATTDAIMEFADWPDHQIDSVWWDVYGDWGCHPSEFVEPFPSVREFLAAGNDPVESVIRESRRRGFEVFVSHRMNQPPDLNVLDGPPRLQETHPDWLINFNPDPAGDPIYTVPWQRTGCMWNFAVPEVHKHRKKVVCELAERYDIDGILLDWSRGCPHLPVGQQWVLRDCLTRCMRLLRRSLQEVARKRSRPLIVAARVPETAQGCHFDGMDVETWIDERLVDMLVLGDRSLEVDIAAFRRLTAGSHIKLYPSYDDHHSSDGYKTAPIEVLRGVASNWRRQGADGIHLMNFECSTPEALKRVGFWTAGHESSEDPQEWRRNAEVFRQIGGEDSLHHRDKTFVVQRRAGGIPFIIGFPEEGHTQRLFYHLANMESALPARLGQHGRGLTLLHLYVGDDVDAEADNVQSVALRILLSDPNSSELPRDQLIQPGIVRRSTYGESDYSTIPVAKELLPRIEVRLNNVALGPAKVDQGWQIFPVHPSQMAKGVNLVGVRVANGPVDQVCFDLASCAGSTPPPIPPEQAVDDIRIEKVELDVKYRDDISHQSPT